MQTQLVHAAEAHGFRAFPSKQRGRAVVTVYDPQDVRDVAEVASMRELRQWLNYDEQEAHA
jgi:hypothetical protein